MSACNMNNDLWSLREGNLVFRFVVNYDESLSEGICSQTVITNEVIHCSMRLNSISSIVPLNCVVAPHAITKDDGQQGQSHGKIKRNPNKES